MGVVFLEQGKTSQALAYLDKALEFDPDHEQALLNSAILLQEFGQEEFRKTAQERLLKLLQKVRAMLRKCKFNSSIHRSVVTRENFYVDMNIKFMFMFTRYSSRFHISKSLGYNLKKVKIALRRFILFGIFLFEKKMTV